VLYRSNLQAGDMEAELKARGLPYQLFGGTQTFEKKEVKDVLAYLAVASDPYNELAVRRSLNYPARGIGEAALARLSSHATAFDMPLMTAVERAHAIDGLSESAREGCRSYARLVFGLRRDMDQTRSATELVGQLTKDIDLERAIAAECGQGRRPASVQCAAPAQGGGAPGSAPPPRSRSLGSILARHDAARGG
jgi:DNA helicase-2/ATP-dependent DNA helicase PcrA